MSTQQEQVFLTNSTTINGLSSRTVLIDGSIASAAAPYIFVNDVIAICDTTTYGNVFIQLARGTYIDSTTQQSTTDTDQYVVVENIGTGTITVTTTAGLTMDGAASYVVTAMFTVRFVLMDTIWRPILISQPPSTIIPITGTSTPNAVVRWSGTAGNAFKDSLVTIDASNNITLPTVAATNITGALITGTATFSNTTNTLAAAVQNTTAGSTSVVISGYPILGALTSFSNNVIITGNGLPVTAGSLTSTSTCTDTTLITLTAMDAPASITNSILILQRPDYASNVSDALFVTALSQINNVITNLGARVMMVGPLANNSGTQFAFGDDHLMVRSRSGVGTKAAARCLMLGGGGVLDLITLNTSADIIYLGSSTNTSSGLTSTTDNRVINIGYSALAAQNGTNLITVGCSNTMNAAGSTTSVLYSIGATMTSSTDTVTIAANQNLSSPVRTIYMGKASTTITFTNMTDVTHITSGNNSSTDITKGGISSFTSITASGTGNTGFGNSVGVGTVNGVNNAFLGTSINTISAQTTMSILGTSITSTAGTLAGVYIGNCYSVNVGAGNPCIIFGSGAITPVAGRLHIGTATKPLNTSNTVGAAGTAAAVPRPTQYLRFLLNGTQLRIPLFNQA